jgi:hypothetical protein
MRATVAYVANDSLEILRRMALAARGTHRAIAAARRSAVPEVLDDLAARLESIERTFGERIDRVDATLSELRQTTEGGFGRLERRLIQLVQVLIARQPARGRDK